LGLHDLQVDIYGSIPTEVTTRKRVQRSEDPGEDVRSGGTFRVGSLR